MLGPGTGPVGGWAGSAAVRELVVCDTTVTARVRYGKMRASGANHPSGRSMLPGLVPRSDPSEQSLGVIKCRVEGLSRPELVRQGCRMGRCFSGSEAALQASRCR